MRILSATFIFGLMLVLVITGVCTATAAPFKKLEKPPFTERWFGIYVNNERVGFHRQTISPAPGGYQIKGDSSVRMKVMGSSREATTHEEYLVDKTLALRSLQVEQSINGALSSVTGHVYDSTLHISSKNGGNSTDRQIRFKGDIFPGPVLNLYPLMRDSSAGKIYKITAFNPEELKAKEVKITVLGEEKAPDGQPALKLRNTLYPFVNNDIWMDQQGNTIFESVRDGLVTTKAEDPKALAGFVGMVATARKDLVYDFSLVKAEPPITDQARLKGLVIEISGWNEGLPLVQGDGQLMEKVGEELIMVRTGSSVPPVENLPAVPEEGVERYLKSVEQIESVAPEIVAKSRELTVGISGLEVVRSLSSWTADWLKDSVDDGGGALESLKSRVGNCQTHARLYTALARAAGIPTRFVSGLVSLEGKGFLYHSWAESLVGGYWISVDPTYNQLPADPTHIKFFEGHTREDMAPIIAIIGRIRIIVREARYN